MHPRKSLRTLFSRQILGAGHSQSSMKPDHSSKPNLIVDWLHRAARRLRGLPSLLAFALIACASPPPPGSASATATFVVVRHAERSNDDAHDPSLSDAGHARAYALARLLARAPLKAAYATGYRRAQQTAQPAAEEQRLVVTTYDTESTAAAFATQLRVTHADGTVLVVGHSNTVPEIVAALSGQSVEPMADDDFGQLYRVNIGTDGTVTLEESRY
ncbi:MAG TPA: phosphoglycerate mutase family protein [Pseudoxanthomonas sp.]